MTNLDIIKAKSATLSRKQASQIQQQQQQAAKGAQQQRHTTCKYKHQIGYRKSTVLSMFASKWQALHERAANGESVTAKGVPIVHKSLDLSEGAQDSAGTKNKAVANENLKLLVQIFWTCICLLGKNVGGLRA